MAKRAIGIDIGRTHVHAVQVFRRQGRVCVEKILCRPMRRSDDSTEKLLASLVAEHRFDAQAPIAIAAPAEGLFIEHLACDPHQPETLRETIKTALTENLPLPVDSVVADVCPTATLAPDAQIMTVVAAQRTTRQQHQELTGHTGRPAERMDAAIFALAAVMLANYPDAALAPALIAYLNETHLIVGLLQEGHLVLTRNLPLTGLTEEASPTRCALEMELTWRRAFHQPLPPATRLLLAACDAQHITLLERMAQPLGCSITLANPLATLTCTAPHPGHQNYTLATGLALRALTPEIYPGVNLLKDPAQHQHHQQGQRRQVVMTAALVTALILVWAVGLLVQQFFAERTYRQAQKQITEVFNAALPGEPCLQPVEQLREKLKTLQQEYALLAPALASDPLTIMAALTDHTPLDLQVTIESFRIERGQIVLAARGPSFATPYQWQEHLQKVEDFTAVTVGADARLLDDQRGVGFSMTISLSAKP